MQILKAHPCQVSELLLRRWHFMKDCANCDNPAFVSNSSKGDSMEEWQGILPRKLEAALSVAKTALHLLGLMYVITLPDPFLPL